MFSRTPPSFSVPKKIIVGFLAAFILSGFFVADANAATVIYDAIPSPLAPNYPSQPFQAQQTNEFGDYIHLAGTDRQLTTVAVTMSDWALASSSGNVAFCAASASNCDGTGFFWPISVNIYSNSLTNDIPNTLLGTKTITTHISWRPAEDPIQCPTKDSPGYAYKYQSTPGAPDTNCSNGYAFNATFDLSDLNLILPNDVIVGFVYNTQTYGPSPTGVDGPYNSLNIAVPPSNPVTVGTDDSTDQTFWNTETVSYYTNTNCLGNTFCRDTNWGVYGTVAMRIEAVTPAEVSNTVVVRAPDLAPDIATALAVPTWFFWNDVTDVLDNSLGSFVNGPGTPPLGIGSVQITVASQSGCSSLCDRRNLATFQFSGIKLANISTLSFSTYNPSAGNGGSASRSAYLNFNVDFTGTSGAWQRRLVYVPRSNGPVPQNTWSTYDAISSGSALWVYSGPTWPAPNAVAGTTPKTWNQILTDYPNARVLPVGGWLGLRIGEPYPDGYTENLDNFVIGIRNGLDITTTTFDFEPPVPPTPTPTPPSGGSGGGGASNGTLIIEKVIWYGAAASATFSDFSFTVGSATHQFEADGANQIGLDSGLYTVAEIPGAGFTTAYSGDCDASGQVAVLSGQSATCVITNTFAVGGFNPGDEPTPTPTPPPSNTGGGTGGTSGSNPADSLNDQNLSGLDDGLTPTPTASASFSTSSQDQLAAIGDGFLGLALPWWILIVVLLLLLGWFWRQRK